MADDEEKPQTEERLEQQEVTRLIREALSGRRFPPVVQYPEATRGDGLLSSLFSWPVVVWVPECENRLQKPYCLKTGCSCSPRVKEYRQRAVEDVDTKYHLLYIKYQCTGDSKGCFSTVNATFVQRDARLLMHFPFVMTKKSGMSKNLMELVHDGMTSPHGISSTVANIRRRREKRYYKLLCLFANAVRHRRLTNPLYLPPTPPSVGQYMYLQKPLGTETLTAAWLQSTSIYSSLCEQVMSRAKVKKVLRVDHSVKFCKMLKVWPGGTGNRESMIDAKMLLLLQNEIGQIVGSRLTRSENHSETRELLVHVKGALQSTEDDDERVVVSDNANAIRSLVNSVFGDSVGVRQDPFHVVQRFTEKIKGKMERKIVAQQLHEALYSIDGELRPPEEMAFRFETVLHNVNLADISCTIQEWTGSIDSNLKQIRRGDLYVDRNVFSEGGGSDVRVVSTSQLEGFHSALKKMLARSVSVEVGLRILDLFILKHNLKIGSQYGRNPPLHDADILTLIQTATLCRGAAVETPQLEFVVELISEPLRQPSYRSATDLDFSFEQWNQMFETVRIDSQAMENSLQRAHQHSASIRELLSKQLAFIETRRLPRAEFFNSLCINELDYEATIGFSGQEYSLLRQVRSEQQASGQSWADCVMVTTIMYNIVVSSNTNNCLNLRRRSFATLASKIDGLSSYTSQDMQPSRGRNLFCLTRAEPRDDNSPREQELQIQLFYALRKMAGIRKRRQVFSMVYDFVCCICTGIYPKSQFVLLKRWDNLKHKANQGTNLKIKLKLSLELIANLRCTDTHKTRSEKILNHLPIAQAVSFQPQASNADAFTVVHTSTGTNHSGEAAEEGLSVLETPSNGPVTPANIVSSIPRSPQPHLSLEQQ